MSWFLIALFLNLLFTTSLSLAEHETERKPISAVIVGTVYCDPCFLNHFSKTSHFISGATVAVECKNGVFPKQSFRQEVETDEHGEFRVHLPFSVTKQLKKIKGCSVKLIRSNQEYCSVPSPSTSSSSFHLKSTNKETSIFSAGVLTFNPPKQPSLCNSQNSNIQNSMKRKMKQIESSKKIQESDQTEIHPDFFFPPLIPNPFQPPPLIPNPLQPPPIIPNPFQPPPAPLIPNPFQPPPAPLIPNPFQPPPAPPAPLIPNPFQPPPTPLAPLIPNPFQPPPAPPAPFFPLPPSPLFPLPPVPGFTPSPPPPPPPPVFPFPLPPIPRIPGIPPVPPSEQSSP